VSTVYEANGRLGGRMFSNRTSYFGGQITEWGGELIDTGHKTVRKLATRFNLPLDNLLNAQPNDRATSIASTTSTTRRRRPTRTSSR